MVIKTVKGHDREDWDIDLVAVHGLDEDAIGAWTDVQTQTFWLRDLLGETKLSARVLTYGYKADSSSFFGHGSSDRILQHAQTFVAELQADRAMENATERPIVFVCHGLGGILVKRALAYSSTKLSKRLEHLYSIFISTYGILFFGTPHNGFEKTGWWAKTRPRTRDSSVTSQLLDAVAKDSETLQNINEQFSSIAKQYRIYFFWEQLETIIGISQAFVVDETSAAPSLEEAERCGINANHSQMCKFKNTQAPGYRTVISALFRYTRDSPAVIRSRWQEAKKLLAAMRGNEAAELVGFDMYNENKPFNISQAAKSTPDVGNKHFIIPHSVSSIFTGREDITKGLQEKILSKETLKQQKRFVLYGLGGSGKTAFCLKFVQDHRQRFWAIFWIDASTVESAERSLSAIGEAGEKGSKPDAGKNWLSNLDMSWLLVIDNADDPSIDISNFFPAGDRGHIIVTSRLPSSKIYNTIGFHEFKEMDHEDAITLLLKAAFVKDTTDPKTREIARPIVRRLGHLALALIQAGATIAQGSCTLEGYLEDYNRHGKMLMSNNHVRGAHGYRTIYTTWEVSVQMIERQATQAAADAIEILKVLSFLHFDRVPGDLFHRAWQNSRKQYTTALPSRFSWWEMLRWYFPPQKATRDSLQSPEMLSLQMKEWEPVRLRQAIAMLSSFSLLVNDTKSETYSIHPVVQSWARLRMKEDDQRTWFKVARAILSDSITPGLEASDHKFRRTLIPHIDACLHGESQLAPIPGEPNHHQIEQIMKFGLVYAEGGRWGRAAELQSTVLDFRTKTLGLEHVETLQVLSDLGSSYWNQSRIKNALSIQTKVMELRQKALGSTHPFTLVAKDKLAETLWLCGNYPKAAELALSASKGLEETVGEGDPRALMAKHNLARCYYHLGRYDEALVLQTQVLQARENMFGHEHLDTLSSKSDLGMTYNVLKRHEEAEKLLVFVRKERTRQLGTEHAYTLWAINDLSKIYSDSGHPRKASALLEGILEIVDRTLGIEHIGSFMTMANLVRAYIRQGQWTRAEKVLVDLVDAQTRKLGAKHPDRFFNMLQLAVCYENLEQLDEAEALVLEVSELAMTDDSVKSPRWIQAQKQLGNIRKKRERKKDTVTSRSDETLLDEVDLERITVSKADMVEDG